jgi:tripartite ATP-independent transporter DctM subunit
VGIELGLLKPELLQALPNRIFGIMANDTLLAIPFFTFMGLILERSGMAEDLLDTIGQLFGPIRGGVAYAVIFVGALLAATTGVVAASVISMGLISLPVMLRYGYDKKLASGVIAASGTLAQIIPPSLVLIVMADQLGRSVGDMYTPASSSWSTSCSSCWPSSSTSSSWPSSWCRWSVRWPRNWALT